MAYCPSSRWQLGFRRRCPATAAVVGDASPARMQNPRLRSLRLRGRGKVSPSCPPGWLSFLADFFCSIGFGAGEASTRCICADGEVAAIGSITCCGIWACRSGILRLCRRRGRSCEDEGTGAVRKVLWIGHHWKCALLPDHVSYTSRVPRRLLLQHLVRGRDCEIVSTPARRFRKRHREPHRSRLCCPAPRAPP